MSVTRYQTASGQVITITTELWRVAIPRNGNVGNPTRYSRWTATDADGNHLASGLQWAQSPQLGTRWEVYEEARKRLTGDSTVRPYWVVQAEMRQVRTEHSPDRRIGSVDDSACNRGDPS